MTREEIVRSILNKLDDGFERRLFNASVDALDDQNNPIRFNTFAFSLRELIRNYLSQRAPDKEVLNCQWYQNITQKSQGVARTQKMSYAIRGGLSNDFVENELEFDLHTITKELRAIIDDLSKYTHIEPEIFDMSDKEGIEIVNKSLKTLNKFLKRIAQFREAVINSYINLIWEITHDALISESINELDILSTHYYVDEALIDDITINYINDVEVDLLVLGYVEVSHQYGSNGDLRQGDGVEFDESYPFKIPLKIDVLTPLDFAIEPKDIEVDNSKFYE
ncbi:MAG: hypothetical protein AWL62_1706 [Halanaerobium sp. T82-1]|nr:MAG: hypothetical protein AWL62_1706 [Halanaerobium sp. T82-1]